MDQLTIFDVLEGSDVVMCAGISLAPFGLPRIPAHPTTADKFTKGQTACVECFRVRSKYYNAQVGHKKARYNPDTGEKWCYKIKGLGEHWEDPDKFGPNKQWDDGKHPHCDTCSGTLWVQRNLPETQTWRALVLARDDHACLLCGSKDNLRAHHKDGWHWCEERRFDVGNGVTVCDPCHSDFHDKYGWGNNTEAQWEEHVIGLWT
jgi:hypothetical protein